MSINLKIGVIGHKREYDTWIRDLAYDDRDRFHFICNPQCIRGNRFSSIIRLHNWYLLAYSHELYALALTRVESKEGETE